MDINKQILRLNYSGLPMGWVNFQTAVRLYCNDQVTYECGSSSLLIKGGKNKISGLQSKLEINSIIATKNSSKLITQIIFHLLQILHYLREMQVLAYTVVINLLLKISPRPHFTVIERRR